MHRPNARYKRRWASEMPAVCTLYVDSTCRCIRAWNSLIKMQKKVTKINFRIKNVKKWQLGILSLTNHIIEPCHDKTNKVTVHPAKTQISLGIRPVWSESSLWTEWVAKDPSLLHVDSEDTDQTGQMSRLIWVFAGRTLILLVLSCRGSIFFCLSKENDSISCSDFLFHCFW